MLCILGVGGTLVSKGLTNLGVSIFLESLSNPSFGGIVWFKFLVITVSSNEVLKGLLTGLVLILSKSFFIDIVEPNCFNIDSIFFSSKSIWFALFNISEGILFSIEIMWLLSLVSMFKFVFISLLLISKSILLLIWGIFCWLEFL